MNKQLSTACFVYKDGKIVEQPTMAEPDKTVPYYANQNASYRNHIAGLKSYDCSPVFERWIEDQDICEGAQFIPNVDFVITTADDGTLVADLPALSEEEVPADSQEPDLSYLDAEYDTVAWNEIISEDFRIMKEFLNEIEMKISGASVMRQHQFYKPIKYMIVEAWQDACNPQDTFLFPTRK